MGQSNRPSFFKRVYFILPDFQIQFLTQISAIVIIVLVTFYGLEYLFLREIFSLEQYSLSSAEGLYFRLRGRMDMLFASKVLALIFIFLVWGVLYSHKIAGPIWRVLKMMDQILEDKDPDDFKLRQTDYFGDLATKLEEIYNLKVNLNKKIKSDSVNNEDGNS